MSFSDSTKKELGAKLSPSAVKAREQAGRQVSYIEAWHAIAEANRIFGFDAWSRETIDLRCVSEKAREIGKNKTPGWGVTYIAKVRVIVDGVIREGCGAGHGIDKDLGQAHESALKEAETDAMKRAFMTFGNPFGLALYDKERANVGEPEPEQVNEAERDKFIAECRAAIETFTDTEWLAIWWSSEPQKAARRVYDLSQAQVDELKAAVIKRRAELVRAAA